jgi:putative Mg2+ transporter-C (MgtC) family protein
MMTSIMVGINYGNVGETDPSRIAAGVVTGIGFLGAGAIIRYGSSIRGLTTAASIWAVAAIGLAIGAGLYEAAGITTIVSLAILILSRLEERMELKKHGKKLKVVINASDNSNENEKEEIKSIIEVYGGKVKRFVSKDVNGKREFVFDLILARIYHKDIVCEISSLPDVKEVKWE